MHARSWAAGPVRWLSVIGVLALACTMPAHDSVAATTNRVGSVVAVIPVSAAPTAGLVAESSGVWIPSDQDGSILRVDPSTERVSTIRVGTSPSCSLCWGAIASHNGAIWATLSSARLAIVRIDAVTNQVTATIPLTVFPSGVLSGDDGTLWLASVQDGALIRFDPLAGRVVARLSIERPRRLAAGGGAVWVTSRADDLRDGHVVRVDPLTNQVVATINVGGQPDAIAFGEGGVWALDEGAQHLLRIDPQANTVVTSISAVGLLPAGVVVGEGSVWVVSRGTRAIHGPALQRLDPSTNLVTGSLPLGEGTAVGLAMGGGSIWVAMRDPDALVRVRPGSSVATDARGSAPPITQVLPLLGLLAGLGVVCLRHPAAQVARSSSAQGGYQLLGLRDFAQRRARARGQGQ